jgi:tRNA (pseudouridine54-N1)-methyltransferase
MKIIFFIKSSTVNLNNYTIKDIPGSSGRLDVISRCILSAILRDNDFERNVQIWIFLDRYGTFIFDPELFNYETFPKNELLITDYFVGFLKKRFSIENPSLNPLNLVKRSDLGIIEAIKHFQKLKYNIFVLKEGCKDFFKFRNDIRQMDNIIFILGSQNDEFLDSRGLLELKIPTLNIGVQSYLASSVIRLLKLHLLALP